MIPLLDGIQEGTMVYADKGYASRANRQCLQDRALKDGMMEKAHRGHPLSAAQKMRNGCPAQVRNVAEQSFGIVHRKFRHARAPYFGLQNGCPEPSESDVFEPAEGGEQDTCVRNCLKRQKVPND